ncbi:MAG: ABC transporter ATP-binding protein [Lutibacter sp.]
MSEIILKIENLSKQYRLGLVGTGTMGDDLKRWWANIRGKEDPFLKIGDVNNRATKGTSDYVWALKDINFEVQQGEVLGIIGKNGAGKSTLLKILSKITGPTTGSIKSKGRVASLLEVGTGFHGEMTGRENIFLNGAILGMTKKEIAGKLDEIIEFSGCERYIDTPVKRYSSGMTVRLAFAVAAFLEPDILIIDEVLAVGDAEFQKKAIGKMQEISAGGGRTVLFVSHNMAAVKSLCTKGVLLENGKIKMHSDIISVVNEYTNSSIQKSKFEFKIKENKTHISKVILKNNHKLTNIFSFNDDIIIEVKFSVYNSKVMLALNLKDSDFNVIFIDEFGVSESGEVQIKIPKNSFLKGLYYVDVHLYTQNVEFYDSKIDEIVVLIDDLPKKYMMYNDVNCGIITSPLIWSKI